MNHSTAACDNYYRVSVLIVDDSASDRTATCLLLKDKFKDFGEDLNLQEASTLDEAFALLTRFTFQIVLLDKDLGKNEKGENVDGIESISQILDVQPFTQIIMLTGNEDSRSVVRALELGAVDYLVKRADPDYVEYVNQKIRLSLGRALSNLNRERIERTHQEVESIFVSVSPSMKQLEHQLEALAEVDRPVIFLGASGLGKGAAAKRLNELRAKYLKQEKRPFVNLNVGNFASQEMLMAELFGYEANSFTGASDKTKPGYFDLAQGGDIFLDEFGEASEAVQVALLKVVEEKEFTRVGGGPPVKANARIILATNRNLEQRIAEGKFRQDLYNRFAFKVQIPPLEDRKEDLKEITRTLFNRLITESGVKNIKFSDLPDDLLTYLCRDNIPGNIRGIENELDQLLIWSPKDKDNRPDFTKWKSTLKLTPKSRHNATIPKDVLTLDHLLSLPTEMLDHNFPGLTAVKDLLETKLLEEALKKFPDSLTKRATYLKIPIPNASKKYAEMGVPRRRKARPLSKELENGSKSPIQ